jgi:hypothetical protein
LEGLDVASTINRHAAPRMRRPMRGVAAFIHPLARWLNRARKPASIMRGNT